MRFWICVALCWMMVGWIMPVAADPSGPVPLPERKTTPEALERERAEQVQQAESLKKQAEEQERDLTALREKLVTLNDKTDQEEARLADLKTEIAALTERRADLVAAISRERGVVAELLVVMQRLRRLPPEALVFSPDPPAAKAQQGVLLAHLTRALHTRTLDLRDQLAALETTERTLTDRRSAQEETLAAIRGETKAIDALMTERQKRIRSTRVDLEKQEQALARIAREAETLRDLMRNIARYNEEQARSKPPPSRARKAIPRNDDGDETAAQTAPVSGHRLPARGTITIAYGGRNAQGIRNEGITLSVRPGMIVSSPLAGRVKYTGPFKHYGNLTILEHRGRIHTLVAGSYKIDTVVGQDIAASEPIGRVLSDASQPKIYFEVRRNGAPVDPLTVIKP